jgi:hypothetical protein
VSILIASCLMVGRWRGTQPAANVSMITMREPQHGQGCVVRDLAGTSPLCTLKTVGWTWTAPRRTHRGQPWRDRRPPSRSPPPPRAAPQRIAVQVPRWHRLRRSWSLRWPGWSNRPRGVGGTQARGLNTRRRISPAPNKPSSQGSPGDRAPVALMPQWRQDYPNRYLGCGPTGHLAPFKRPGELLASQ